MKIILEFNNTRYTKNLSTETNDKLSFTQTCNLHSYLASGKQVRWQQREWQMSLDCPSGWEIFCQLKKNVNAYSTIIYTRLNEQI